MRTAEAGIENMAEANRPVHAYQTDAQCLAHVGEDTTQQCTKQEETMLRCRKHVHVLIRMAMRMAQCGAIDFGIRRPRQARCPTSALVSSLPFGPDYCLSVWQKGRI
jgi:hypothetical protein